MQSNSTNKTSTPLDSSLYLFHQIFPVFVIVFGLIGNTITIYVLNKKKYHGITTCFYMKTLALSDNFVMLMFFLRWLNKLQSTPLPHDTYFCILYFFFVRMGLGVSAWVLMFMTVDKYVFSKFPHKAIKFCTIRNAKIGIIVILFVHAFGHLPYFWRYADHKAATLSGRCPFNLSKTFQTTYKLLRIILIDRFIPWLVTLIFATLISFELYKQAKRSTVKSQRRKEFRYARRVTVMSLIVAWMFFLLTFPTSVNEAIRDFHIGTSVKLSAFLYDLFVYLLYLNSAINFYLYLLVSRSFRNDVKVFALSCLNTCNTAENYFGWEGQSSNDDDGLDKEVQVCNNETFEMQGC